MESAITEIEVQKYETYTDSGVEWLGKIPEHWLLLPGSRVVNERSEKNKGMVEKTVLSLSYGKVVIKPEEKLVGLVPESFETYQLVYPGDIIIRPTDLQNDKTSLRTGLAKDKGIITSAYINLKVNKEYSDRYYHYFLYALDITKMIYSLGSGLRQNLSFEDFKRFKFLVPPTVEQTAIVDFLNRKTTQIDQAIAQKERLIKLLQERRQILIQRAVTRGLNPDVPMKDSGVEWIGEVPKHWDVKKLKFILRTQGRIGFKGYTTSDLVDASKGALTFGASHINWEGEFDLSEPVYISWKKYFESPEIMVSKGDILIVQRGSTCGKVALVRADYGPATINPSLVLIKEIREQPEYVFHGIKAVLNGILHIVSATAIPMLSQFQIDNISIPVPPKYEQELITERVAQLFAVTEKAIRNELCQIDKLREYKSTLIAAAVTGKIKVC